MAGHSQFKNIMYRKGAQDAKRAKLFTKLIRELTVSARHSPDPDANPRLRSAILAARQANMPKDTMERAILKGSNPGGDGENFESIRYEGYGPGGVALIIEALTDNRNRTAPEIRTAFSRSGGNLGEANSVSFQFEHVGQLEYENIPLVGEALFDLVIESGAEDVIQDGTTCQIFSDARELHKVKDSLMKGLGEPVSYKLVWRPLSFIKIEDEDTARSLLKLIDTLEDNDDVQSVFSNFDIDPNLLERIIS